MPASFTLLNVSGSSYVSSVKSQSGGTCWTHGTMAAMESNLMMTGLWKQVEGENESDLAEYHLDWWNGFNEHYNGDRLPPNGSGLFVHYGGDYRVASAYLARGDGAVRDKDGQNFEDPPLLDFNSYHRYYPMHIEWYTMDDELDGIGEIKKALMESGAIGTCMCANSAFMDEHYNHYQPPGSDLEPNHAVAIVGWDDTRDTQAPQDGAWLVKNSWGASWGNNGYFWLSYYDRWSCRHPEMGAVSFRDVSYLTFQHAYSHDYHGWRDTWTYSSEAFNRFTALEYGQLHGVNFYTTEDETSYRIVVYDSYEDGRLSEPLRSFSGHERKTGLHTLMFEEPIDLKEGDDFCILLNVSKGGIAFDRTSKVPVLLDRTREPGFDSWITSHSEPGQSYYRNGSAWEDLHYWNESSNFCIKGLVGHVSAASPAANEHIGRSPTFNGSVSSHIDQVKVRIDDGPLGSAIIASGKWSAHFSDLELTDGAHTLHVFGYQDGFRELHAETTRTFQFDGSAPVTNIFPDGRVGENGWFVGEEVLISLVSEDGLSGVRETHYRINESEPFVYSAPFYLQEEGEHLIQYWSVDRAGNAEAPGLQIVKLDKTPPRTYFSLKGDEVKSGWYASPVRLTMWGEDHLSGFNSTVFTSDNINFGNSNGNALTFKEEGEYLLFIHSTDHAGNSDPPTRLEFTIDLTPPVTHHRLEGEEGSNGWYTSPVSFFLSSDEEVSEVEDIWYRIDGGEFVKYWNSLYLNREGFHAIEYYSVNSLELEEDISNIEVRIDLAPPITNLELHGETGVNGLYKGPVSLEFSGSDKTSGINSTFVSIDNLERFPVDEMVQIGEEGLHLVEYYSMDNAGIREQVREMEFAIDITPPEIRWWGIDRESVQYSRNITFKIAANDLLDDVMVRQWRLNEGEWMEFTNLEKLYMRNLSLGVHTVHIKAADGNGNTNRTSISFELVDIGSLLIDGEDPVPNESDEMEVRPLLPVFLISALMAVPVLIVILGRKMLFKKLI
ncbi:MAG: OmpL47-type beta-barrel domain-containing protein [Thermoplasmatota archaeon]